MCSFIFASCIRSHNNGFGAHVTSRPSPADTSEDNHLWSRQHVPCALRLLNRSCFRASESPESRLSLRKCSLDNFSSKFSNVSSSDVLSPEELQQYKELEESGQVLEGPQLDAMAACLNGLGNLVPAEQNPQLDVGGLAHVVPELRDKSKQEEQVQKQINKLDQQLLRLNSRRDHLSLQELSVGAELDELQTLLDSEQRCMTQQLMSASGVAQELADHLAKLSASTVQLTDVLTSLTQQGETGQALLVCSDFKAWQREEQRCSDALESLASKLFSLDKSMVTANFDLTSLSEDASTTIASLEQSSLALRQTPEEHSHLTAELQRLHRLVQKSSKASTAAEVLAARHKAELEEAGRALERVNRGHYSSATEDSLREEDHNVRGVAGAVRAEVEEQQAVVDALVERCADRPSTATLTADCTAKKLRQLYYSRQQQQVMSQELEQLARHDLVAVLVQCEAEAVQQTLQLLAEASYHLNLQHHAALLRSAKLKQLGLCIDEDRAVGTIPASLQVLVPMMGGEEEGDRAVSKLSDALTALSGIGASREVSCGHPDTSQMGAVCSALEQLWQQLQEARQALGSYSHSHALHKLWSKCGLLEECLGGSGGRLPGSLPSCWLPAPLMDAHADLETRAYQLKHDMMAFLKQYEHKKKILSGQPELEEQLSSWTNPVTSE